MPIDVAVPAPVEGAGLLLSAIELFSKVQAAITWACATDRDAAAINAAINTIRFMQNPSFFGDRQRMGRVKIPRGMGYYY